MIQNKQSDGTIISMQSKLAVVQSTEFHLISAHNGSRHFEYHRGALLSEIQDESAGMDFNLILVENKGQYQSKQNLFRDRKEFLFLHEANNSQKERFYFANDQLSLMDAYFKLPFKNNDQSTENIYFNLAMMMPPYTAAKDDVEEIQLDIQGEQQGKNTPIITSIQKIIHHLKTDNNSIYTLGKLIYYFDKYLFDYPNLLTLISEELKRDV